MRAFNLFISHSWSYGDQYDRLLNLLQRRSYFRFRDFSVPRYDPIHSTGSDAALRQAIMRQMAPCSVVLVLSGVYATHSRWINVELSLTKTGFFVPKPVIAIKPWGNMRTSVPVKKAADRIVGWNTESIVKAIRDLA